LDFYDKSFAATEILHLEALAARLQAGRMLEKGVFADMNGKPSVEILKGSLTKMQEARRQLDSFYEKVGELRQLNRTHELIPQYSEALARVLADHPPLERVTLRQARFSNIAAGSLVRRRVERFGDDLDGVLASLQEDSVIVAKQLDETVAAFREVLPMAEQGGFAAMVLSGRAPLPEKVMQSSDLMMVFAHFYNRACQATIAADMHIYPKGLEWLKKPTKEWDRKGGEIR
jgi:hypothetical protein